MSNIGSLIVRLEGNIERFEATMNRGASVADSTMGKIKGVASVAVAALAAVGVALSVGALVEEANRAIDALADLDDMSQKTGASVENLSRLSKVALLDKTDFAGVDTALVKLSKNMVAGGAQGEKFERAMRAIGLSTDGIASKDPAQVFIDISNALQEFGDRGGKAAAVSDLMGKSAADLIPYMNDVAENVGRFTGSSAAAAAAASRYQDSLGMMKVRYNDLTTAVVSAALPAAADFVGALSDLIDGADGVKGVDVAQWADDVAIGLARVGDVAMILPRLFSAISGSVKVVVADIGVVGAVASNFNAISLAKHAYNGTSPVDAVKKVVAERDKVLAAANAKYEVLLTTPVDRMEAALLKRIAARNTGGASGDWGRDKPNVQYTGGDEAAPKPKVDAEQKAIDSMIAKLREQAEAYGLTGAALLSYQLTKMDVTEAERQQALAFQTTVDDLQAEDAATKKREDRIKKEADEAKRQADQNAENVRQIKTGLMNETEREGEAHRMRLEELQAFHDAKLENTMEANELIEAENARHEQTLADMRAAHNLSMLGMMGSSSDQLYDLMRQAGMDQTALGKAVFLASKAIAVAEIIMNTNVAASKAMSQFGAWGAPIAGAIKIAGYASAGIVAGLAVAEASAEGGFDIPAGENPVTQLHEREMVLPKVHADVIRGLAADGGGSQKPPNITVVNNGSPLRVVSTQKVAPDEWAMIVEDAKNAVAADLFNANSAVSRSMGRNFNAPRSR